jgi:rhodanese-related sulfurtransferase
VSGVDRLLDEARQKIGPRVTVDRLEDELARGTLVVDIRPVELRQRDGELPGSVVIGRNVLEWRLDPTGDHRIDEASDPDRRVIVVCDEGYASSLAAATLLELGRTDVTDLSGGYQAWLALGAPTD